jgi:hypothetical protein
MQICIDSEPPARWDIDMLGLPPLPQRSVNRPTASHRALAALVAVHTATSLNFSSSLGFLAVTRQHASNFSCVCALVSAFKTGEWQNVAAAQNKGYFPIPLPHLSCQQCFVTNNPSLETPCRIVSVRVLSCCRRNIP